MIENTQFLNAEIINDLLEMLGNDISEILTEFQTSALKQFESARYAAENSDTENLLIIIHSLKGAAGNIGLQKLYESCQQLEASLRNNEEIDIETTLVKIQNEYFHTISELKELHLIN